jgi:hypothetical protein
MRHAITREEARDMADAHGEGLHAELPRDGCPECTGREFSSYRTADELERRRREREASS